MNDPMTRAVWRKSSFSTAISGGGDCLEVATLDHGRVALRDSKRPHDAPLLLSRAEMAAFVQGVKRGEFDILA